MAYKIILQRISEYKGVKKPNNNKVEDSTIGEFILLEITASGILKEKWRCFTCENIGPSTDTPNQDKRIMPREYKIEWTDSSKNASLAKHYSEYKMPNGRNKALWVTCDDALPNFRNRRILIHVGNYPQDTEGCILLGKNKGEGTVSGSVQACHEFFQLMNEIGPENCILEVKEIK